MKQINISVFLLYQLLILLNDWDIFTCKPPLID